MMISRLQKGITYLASPPVARMVHLCPSSSSIRSIRPSSAAVVSVKDTALHPVNGIAAD